MLSTLQDSEGDLTVNGLAEAMEISGAAAYQLLTSLVDKGRCAAQRNGRAAVYSITGGHA